MNEPRQTVEDRCNEPRELAIEQQFNEHQVVIRAAIIEIAADIGITLDRLLTVEYGGKYSEVYPVLKLILERLHAESEEGVRRLAEELGRLRPWAQRGSQTVDDKCVDNDEDSDEEDDDWEQDDWEDGEQGCGSEYDSPQEEVIGRCHGAMLFGGLADFAPLHAALDYIAATVDSVGFNIWEEDGREVFLDVARKVIPDSDILEHNPWLSCFYCRNEVLPEINEAFLETYYDWKSGAIGLHEFYRCPDCGGPITAKKNNNGGERHLPWFHYAHGEDFDVADEDKPRE